MYSRRRILRVIEGLKKHDALLLAVWDLDGTPWIWLKDWCQTRSKVSVGLAEAILEEIIAGKLRPSERRSEPMRVYPRKRLPERGVQYVETTFNAPEPLRKTQAPAAPDWHPKDASGLVAPARCCKGATAAVEVVP